jgi:lipopolysaccharide transport system ATP-binding protein
MALALDQFNVWAPDGAVIGVIGEDGSGVRDLLEAAQGKALIADGDCDSIRRASIVSEIERARRSGRVVLAAGHDEEWLRSISDEMWWIDDHRVAAKAHPDVVLPQWRRHVARRLREAAADASQQLTPSMRRGDGRAELLSVETLGENGSPSGVWRSGEHATVRLLVRFHGAVADPVVGIMIRTRIGFEVYGTNTELEGVKLGPCSPGETLEIRFEFECALCPREYTITAASHDPDGVWHDWIEDAVAFAVVDERYTAGVANLRARVTSARA